MKLIWKLCKRGHELTPTNISWSRGTSGKPQRQCKTCHRRTQEYRTRRDDNGNWILTGKVHDRHH